MSVPALPFPAAEMETLARSQAWVRFLGEVRFSLEVWATDSEVRDGCEPVVEWIRRCGRELSTFGSGRRARPARRAGGSTAATLRGRSAGSARAAPPGTSRTACPTRRSVRRAQPLKRTCARTIRVPPGGLASTEGPRDRRRLPVLVPARRGGAACRVGAARVGRQGAAVSAPYSESIRARANELYKPGVYGVSRVARDLGVSNTTVRRWVDPEFAESSRRLARENKKRYRGTCVDCGSSTAYSGVRSLGSDRCQACRRRYQHENRRWTAEAVVAAIRLFVDRHGRPPVSREWARADRGCDYPTTNTVARSGGWRSAPFATWNDALTAAGCPAYAPGCYPRTAETRARMSAAQRARQERERAGRGRR